MPPELVARVLESASKDLVLVGGQALAFWMDYFDVPPPTMTEPAITRDVDFFTPDPANTAPLRAFANAIHGRPDIRDIRALSPLIGSAVANAGDGRLYIVDLLHDVVGVDREQVDAKAVPVEIAGALIRVMHPLDVLQSRSANLHQLAEKQNDQGRLQLRLAIEVARAFLSDQMKDTAEWDDYADLVHDLGNLARSDAARKNAARHGLHVADALPAWLIDLEVFRDRQWPHLRQLMSPQYADRCEALWNARGK